MVDSKEAIHDLLTDAFTRLIEHVDQLTDGLSENMATYRPTPEANTIAWLLWHSARVQDAQVADVAGVDQVWKGWVERFALELPDDDTGYGHSAQDVGKVRASAELLAGYYRGVHEMTLTYLAELDADELERVIDENWDPPVTAGVRLVSVIDDCAQHLGQAAYVRGIAP
ncbi:mycothiol transferase [soil metagenome]